MEAVCRNGLPDTFSVEARFLRPVFWDDAIDIEGCRDVDGSISELRATNSDGKTVADLCVIA